jgi:pimeloyl-ACP methyl ester carboxylesterase
LPDALAASPEIAAYAAAHTGALSRGEIKGAVEASVHMWLDGPRRAADQLDPALREQVATMQLAAFRQTRDHAADFTEEPLVSELADRLYEIDVPTLVLVGEFDLRVAREQARVIADEIQPARLEIIERTAHAPNLERPAAFDAAVLPFLESLPGGSG